MAQEPLTPEEYELHLKDLRERLRLYLERGEGNSRQLLHDTESVLELADDFPEVMERNQDVHGLVGELLARQQQERFFAESAAPREAPGCLLGWFFPRRRR
jgi:hypothetical protein